jgi:hypothetical protein
MSCPNCEKLRATLEFIRDNQFNTQRVAEAIESTLGPTPEERGETPLFPESK